MKTKEEVLINGVLYMNTRRAGRVFGYTHDYIGQLARKGKIKGHTFGRTLFVSEPSIARYAESEKEEKVKRAEGRKKIFREGRKVPIRVMRTA